MLTAKDKGSAREGNMREEGFCTRPLHHFGGHHLAVGLPDRTGFLYRQLSQAFVFGDSVVGGI
jgi:hypothetical protein